MSDKRKIQIPFYPYLLLLIGLVFVVISGLYYLNYPSQQSVSLSLLGSGIVLSIVAFICRPALLKEIFANKKTFLWANDVILILVIVAIGVLVSHIAFRHNFRYDFTRNKIFSLSELTIKTVRELDKEVKITAFFPKGSNEEGIMLDLFKEYKRHNDKLVWTMIDPMVDPVTAQRMNITVMGTVVVECGKNEQKVLPEDLFFIPNNAMSINDTPKFTGEQALTSAIANVLSNQKRVVSFITGHEEASISGRQSRDLAALSNLLNNENFEVVENSLITGDIDERANVTMVVGPKKDFLESEIEKLKNYVENKKGHIIFAFDPNPDLKNLYDFIFKEYGVTVNHDIVVDPRGVSQNYWTVAPELAEHEITAPIISKKLIGLMFHVCSINAEKRTDLKQTELFGTIRGAWAKRNLSEDRQLVVAFEKEYDAEGPFCIGIIGERTDVASGSKAIIIGDADMFGNTYLQVSGNRDLVINSINWLAGNNKMLSIRPRILELPKILFNEGDSTKIFTLCVFGAPCLILLLGLIVFLYRRRVR